MGSGMIPCLFRSLLMRIIIIVSAVRIHAAKVIIAIVSKPGVSDLRNVGETAVPDTRTVDVRSASTPFLSVTVSLTV